MKRSLGRVAAVITIALTAITGSIAVAEHAGAAAPSSFTVDVAPTVGQTSTIDARAVVPAGASVTSRVEYRRPGCCGATVVIAQLGRTAVVTWTPAELDGTHGFVTIVVDVGVPNPANHLVKHTLYSQSFVVQPSLPDPHDVSAGPFGAVVRAPMVHLPTLVGMAGCQTGGIIFSAGVFGSSAYCSSSGGPIASIRTYVSCNNDGLIRWGPWTSVAGHQSLRYCPAGQSVTAYGYQTTHV